MDVDRKKFRIEHIIRCRLRTRVEESGSNTPINIYHKHKTPGINNLKILNFQNKYTQSHY